MPKVDDNYQDELNHEEQGEFSIRMLEEKDLEGVVGIDTLAGGTRREEYYQGKFRACVRDPGMNTSLLAEQDGLVVGFLFGRVFQGEFGMTFQRAVLDTIGVHPRLSGHHIASGLMSQYQRNMQALRVEAINTLVAWDRFDLLRFFHSVGFKPSRDLDLVWDISRYPFQGRETQVETKTGIKDDLEGIVRLDEESMGRTRRGFIQARFQAAESRPNKNRIIVARMDGELVGFLGARIYQGEFGIEEVRGVIEAIAVRPAFQQMGVGSALLEGLLGWLLEENVQWVETLVHWNDWPVLRFMEYAGFRPSSRINLEWRFG